MNLKEEIKTELNIKHLGRWLPLTPHILETVRATTNLIAYQQRGIFVRIQWKIGIQVEL